MCIRSVTKSMSVRLCKNTEENIGHSGRSNMKEEKVKVRECSTKNNEQKCCLVVWPLQTFWASVDLHQWSYKYVRNVARFVYMLERKNKHSKNFVVRGRLCAQPRSGWLVPSWKIRHFSRHFCCMFSLQSIIGSLNNQDGDDYKWIRATWNFIALILTRSIRKNVGKIFLELNSKRLYQNSGREKESRCLVFTSSTQREIRDFHVVVMLRQQRNVQKTVMYVQSCFANVDGGEMATGDAINQARGLARKPLLSDKRDKEHAFLMRKG